MSKFLDWLFDGYRYLFLGCLVIWTFAMGLIFLLGVVGMILQVFK